MSAGSVVAPRAAACSQAPHSVVTGLLCALVSGAVEDVGTQVPILLLATVGDSGGSPWGREPGDHDGAQLPPWVGRECACSPLDHKQVHLLVCQTD